MQKAVITNNFNNNIHTYVSVKSKLGAEFRRFGLRKDEEWSFERFYSVLEKLHFLSGIPFLIYYTDKDGELLPVNNDSNLACMIRSIRDIVRLVLQRKGESHSEQTYNCRRTNRLTHIFDSVPCHHAIKMCEDFRIVSSIIDADILPENFRRVRLHKYKESKPLGFYVRDGTSLKVKSNGNIERIPGIFISRLLPGGLAESTGLLSVNDEIIEVNGIEVMGKTLDQVTDMMIANSRNLIITVKPANQNFNPYPRNRIQTPQQQSNDLEDSSEEDEVKEAT